MPLYLPPEADNFPHPFTADAEGFLAFGSNLKVETLLVAYQHGIFPWYNEGDPILWWFTHPRCVLFPSKIKISKSMRPYLNKEKYSWTLDTDFANVMNMCRGTTRKGQHGTWITEEMFEAYNNLHEAGYAHSLEVRLEDKLVGGLYGLAIGKIFYGESMFSIANNASKFGLIMLAKYLQDHDFLLIDCQQETNHVMSMGAEVMEKEKFWEYLQKNPIDQTLRGKWTANKA